MAPRASRREIVAAIAATIATRMPARAQPAGGADGSMYFAPAGRIGFACPATLKPQTNSWHLLSTDQTLQVEISEALRIDTAWDNRIWGQDSRHVLVASERLTSGIERRQFRDQRYGSDANYGADTYVFRDERWLGQ